jgi:hypothetical protein
MVYVAGPMTLGIREDNIAKAINVGSELIKAGWAAFLPQLSYYWTDVHPYTWEEWLAYDFCIITQCVSIVRIQGKSKGADAEEEFAKTLNIPVYYSVEEFLKNNDSNV